MKDWTVAELHEALGRKDPHAAWEQLKAMDPIDDAGHCIHGKDDDSEDVMVPDAGTSPR